MFYYIKIIMLLKFEYIFNQYAASEFWGEKCIIVMYILIELESIFLIIMFCNLYIS